MNSTLFPQPSIPRVAVPPSSPTLATPFANMDPLTTPPDPRQLHLPVDTLAPLAHSLSDLAHATHPTLPPNPPISTSTADVAHRLALRLHSLPLPPSTPSADVFSAPSHPALARETSLVHALALWATTFLSDRVLNTLSSSLAHDIVAVLKKHIYDLHPLTPFDSPNDARRAALNAALAARYGTLHAAPTAAMIAGAPLVLFVAQLQKPTMRVRSPPQFDAEENNAVLCEWRNVCKGVAVVEAVQVSEVYELRAVVAGRLRDIVKGRGLAPVLVVAQAVKDGDLESGGDVLRAVCDGYGARLHVEGDGMGMLLLSGGEIGLRTLVGVAHSVLLDVGHWFGRLKVAVLLGGEGVEGSCGIEGVMALWFLLERLHLPRCRELLKGAYDGSLVIAESLYSVPHLLEVKTVGCGRHVLVSYSAVHADAESRTAVNRAMFAYVMRIHGHLRHILVLGSHENREWLVFSPLQVLTCAVDAAPITVATIAQVCRDLIYAARRCEVVVNARAAFISQMRQCQDLEVENIALQDDATSSAPLFFAAIRVTPFGEVSQNGHWIKDEDMRSSVEKYTCALASLLEENTSKGFEAIIQDPARQKNEVPMICVGPLLRDPSSGSEKGDEELESNGQTLSAALSDRNAALAEEWDLGDVAAQDIGLSAAETITAVLSAALSTPEEGSEMGDSQVATNGDVLETELDKSIEVGPIRPVSDSVSHSNTTKPTASDSSGDQTDDRLADPVETKIMENGSSVKELGKKATETSVPDERRTNQVGVDREKKVGIWGMLFGDSRDDDDSTSEESTKGLEDDYFRP